jgi:hypothetical protein
MVALPPHSAEAAAVVVGREKKRVPFRDAL